MSLYEELLRKIQTGEAKALKSIPARTRNHNPKVSSIYDTFSFKGYNHIPMYFLFKYDVGLMEWAIMNFDDFCIKEYEYLSKLCTVNKKMFEMSHIQHETMKNFEYYNGFMSGEEMLAAFGHEEYFNKQDVKNENDRKLKEFGVQKVEPKMMDRTYLCFNRSTFPKLTGQWICEKTSRSAKNTANIIYFRPYDENSSYASEFINQRIALFDFNDFYSLLDEKGDKITQGNKLQDGDIFEATTNNFADTKYTFKKTR